MNLTRDRVRSIGWAFVLSICFALTMALTFRVNAVKSQVRLAERQILAVKQDKMLLETEFETRANQQQLRAMNEVEFGYEAPSAKQYIEGERQLAALSQPRPADAPAPIRVARADDVDVPGLQSAVESHAEAKPDRPATTPASERKAPAADLLEERLTHVEHREAMRE